MNFLRSFFTALLLTAFAFAQPQPLTISADKLGCPALNAYLQANLPQPPVIDVPAFDAQNSDAYIKKLNLKHAIEEVYGGTGPLPVAGANAYAAQRFDFQCYMWQMQGKPQTAIPAWPTLMYVDLKDFDAWWAAYILSFDQNSAFYGDNRYSDSLGHNQFYKHPAPPLPFVIVTPAIVANAPSAPASSPVGPPLDAMPMFHTMATSDCAAFRIGQTDPSGKFVLLNPSPMNSDCTKFFWLAR